MESLLSKIHRGKRAVPPRIMVYGTEGIGKSTLAASAWKPIFINVEGSLDQIDCASFPMSSSWSEFEQCLGTLILEPHEYQTVVIDTLDWLEKLIWQKTCEEHGKDSMETWDFQKGYIFALKYWWLVIDGLNRLHDRGMAIVLVAHSRIDTFKDPEGPAYDQYSLCIHKKAAKIILGWCDAVLFGHKKMVIKTEGKGFKQRTIAAPSGASGGERVLRTEGGPTCVAKNRYGMPSELPMAWAAIESYLTAPPAAAAEVAA